MKTVTLAHAAELNVSTSGPDGVDIDLYVVDPQGNLVAASTSSTPNESVSIQRPADGEYTILVHGWNVPNGSAPVTLTIDAIQGADVRLSGLPGSIPAGGSATLTVAWDATGSLPAATRACCSAGRAHAVPPADRGDGAAMVSARRWGVRPSPRRRMREARVSPL